VNVATEKQGCGFILNLWLKILFEARQKAQGRLNGRTELAEGWQTRDRIAKGRTMCVRDTGGAHRNCGKPKKTIIANTEISISGSVGPMARQTQQHKCRKPIKTNNRHN
jgi:hypothetical protein